MDNGQPPPREESNKGQEEGNSLDWLLRKDNAEIKPAPMDTNVLMSRQDPDVAPNTDGKAFTRERVFNAASQGDTAQLHGLLDYLRVNNKRLTSPEFTGELPLSLAACTNQPNIVSFLMENPYRRADLTDRDSQGNTVLHSLVVIADNTTENTDMIERIYDGILFSTANLREERKVQLEAIENNQGLTPLKLAAKQGKIGFTEWVYGPVHSSLYDISSIDTDEENSVLEIVVCGSEIPNRPEMLQIEPLHSLLNDKWDRFASKLFLMNFLVYLMYLIIFTTVAFYRKEGQPPFPIEDVPIDYLRCVGEIISVLGALWFFYKALPAGDALSDLRSFVRLWTERIHCLVCSLALAWINVLYYSRGSKQLGMYNVMMQRRLAFGFSAAIVALIEDHPPGNKLGNGTRGRSFGLEPFKCQKPSYNDIKFTTLELFKFTIGMGDLEFTDHVQYKEVFYVLLILYIVLTYILLLNMLIAVMGNTVERISEESENIWNLQRAFTILDMERTLPKCLSSKLFSGVSKMVCIGSKQDKSRRFLRVEEKDWKRWRCDLGFIQDEDPGDHVKTPQPSKVRTPGSPWRLNPLLARIRGIRRQQEIYSNP
ncbi:Transient receptor potential cation channel subfamily V member 1 [Larimichthys crocea]|uniref:Transient receptor potential cation channel subfamily V member 1 n=1 Tax=Larimichthys crocea TaxID=215358 RepID=A0A6G0ITT5_LARCR|nr:Transient receptor potential cation channel subfamily V member 1 [Larimichthys crocea]